MWRFSQVNLSTSPRKPARFQAYMERWLNNLEFVNRKIKTIMIFIDFILGDFLARAFSTSQNRKRFFKNLNNVSGFAPGHRLIKITVKIFHFGKMKVRVTNPMIMFLKNRWPLSQIFLDHSPLAISLLTRTIGG